MLAILGIHRLGGGIRETLHRNYVSIEAAQHMHAAVWAVQVAALNGTLASALTPNREAFAHWIDVEKHDITETDEDRLANEIDRMGRALFAQLAAPARAESYRDQFAALHSRLDDLIKMNAGAMFRADGRASRLGSRLTAEFTTGLGLLLVIGLALSWTLAWNITKPLHDLGDRMRSFSLRGPSQRLPEQPLAEIRTVAGEFNKMAERLEQFEKLNVDRLIYEKAKTEAIIDSIEDGIVLINPKGIVTHINQIAAIILGVEREDALGSPFDDLNSNHPHYLRIRSALRNAARESDDAQRIEVELFVRGLDHSYMLKPVPLRQDDGRSFGTILTLQDITYLRDQDRARSNLVATLSHELKNPLTSIALSTELLERRKTSAEPEEQKLLAAIAEDIGRIHRLADHLLSLAQGANGSIAIHSVQLDLCQLLRSVSETFALQVQHKGLVLTLDIPDSAAITHGDPVKLSWAVSNLIANALRYTPEGGRIRLALRRRANAFSLKVSDTGPGIPSEIRDRLFERFTQWNVNGFELGSAGLGLAIVKEIIEGHGGRIFVDTTAGKGTCFTLELRAGQENLWLSC